jgi:ubiquinone/menaquinone biosynthesis C-methylase UbiE
MSWNHNTHYHKLLLAQLPSPIERALEVGCGHGELAGLLADVAASVDAIDLDADALNQARELQRGHINLSFIHGDFLRLDLPASYYDVVTSVAALHHMDLIEALGKMKQILRPGGVLAVLGLYRESSVLDFAFSAVAFPVSLFQRHLIHRHNTPTCPLKMAIREPTTTLGVIRETAAAVIPGARVRRHLLWRYSLIWQRPITSGSG